MNIILLVLSLFLLIQYFLIKEKRKKVKNLTEYQRHSNNKPTEDIVQELDLQSPEWYKNAVLYQVNIRQFSEKGDFSSIIPHLPRIKDLGADILWLMPIFPISETFKKCDDTETECWGSPYAPYDFKAVHPRYGTKEDFKELVNQIHAQGMKIILDFVPNHTGWDSVWMKEHPEWYVHKNGKIRPVTSDHGEEWADIAQLDLTNKDLREEWMRVHEYWVRAYDIDGYREDCAWAIPHGWWRELRTRLNQLKPHGIYMLAEDEVHGKEQFNVCFETNYGWGVHHFMKKIFTREMPASYLNDYTEDVKKRFGRRGSQMVFTQNHDENTWHGSETELFGDGADCYTALCFCIEGIPLIYNGQEVGLNKRLAFFNKDEIDWSTPSRADFFKTLTDLKHRNKALWNGNNGGELRKITTGVDDKIYAFYREKAGDRVVGIFNMSDEDIIFKMPNLDFQGEYHEVFGKSHIDFCSNEPIKLLRYEYLIFEKQV
jgi:glycosidase